MFILWCESYKHLHIDNPFDNSIADLIEESACDGTHAMFLGHITNCKRCSNDCNSITL